MGKLNSGNGIRPGEWDMEEQWEKEMKKRLEEECEERRQAELEEERENNRRSQKNCWERKVSTR